MDMYSTSMDASNWRWSNHLNTDGVHPLSQMRKMVDENYEPRNLSNSADETTPKEAFTSWKNSGVEKRLESRQSQLATDEEPLCLTKYSNVPSSHLPESSKSSELISFHPYRRNEGSCSDKEVRNHDQIFSTDSVNKVDLKQSRQCFQPWLPGSAPISKSSRNSISYSSNLLHRFRNVNSIFGNKRSKNQVFLQHMPDFPLHHLSPYSASTDYSNHSSQSSSTPSDPIKESEDTEPTPTIDSIQHRPKSSSSYDSGCPDAVNGNDGSMTSKRKISGDAEQPEDLSVSSEQSLLQSKRRLTVSQLLISAENVL